VLPKHTAKYKAIIDNGDLIKANRALVELPFKGTPRIDAKPDFVTRRGWLAVCAKYAFKPARLGDIPDA
jgi:hypothetical protein